MKKLFLIVFILFSYVNIYNAECNYTELKNLNALASHVDYSYEYDENTGKFNITIINIPNELYVVVDTQNYYPKDNTIIINGLNMGSELSIDIYSSENAECVTQYLRALKIKIPYLNKYYDSKECLANKNLEVCNNKFLNYELTDKTFKELINKNFEETINKKEPTITIEEDEKTTLWDKITKIAKKYGIQTLLILSSCLITYLICNIIYKIIYRKTKHGL